MASDYPYIEVGQASSFTRSSRPLSPNEFRDYYPKLIRLDHLLLEGIQFFPSEPHTAIHSGSPFPTATRASRVSAPIADPIFEETFDDNSRE